MNRKERVDLARWAMEYTLKNGAEQAAVTISNSREIDIEYRDKKLEKVKESTQRSLGLTVYVQQKYSTHSTNDLRKDALKTFIEGAVAGTKYLSKDDYRSLPDPKFYPQDLKHDLHLCDKAYEKIESSERVKMAAEIEAAAMAQSGRIISTTAEYSDGYYESVRVHSNGFLGEKESTSFGAGAEATIDDQRGGRPADWSWASVRFYHELPATELLAQEAVQRALQKIGQRKIESGKYSLIVENRAARQIMGVLRYPMTAQALQQKQSFLDGMLDKQIASEKLTWIDDPLIEKGLGSRTFDNEGLAAKRRSIIEKGILRQYYVDTYYGKKLGIEPNSGSAANVIFEYGDKSLDDLIKDINRGILVKDFIGGNSNSTTGDFSYGIIGQFIENGEIVHPVNEMNISGNAKEFFKQLIAVGNDPYPFSAWRAPSLVFEGVEFSGI